MESIDIVTGQHVTIQYEPASIVQRMLAFMIDGFIIGLYVGVLIFIYYQTEDFFSSAVLKISLFSILSVPALCYHLLFESLMGGQTPGKIVTKTRVTHVDGSTPGTVSYFLRWVLLPIDLLPYGGLGAILILFTNNHQRLGDLAAGTTVVKTMPASGKYDLDSILDEMDERFTPTFPQVEMLTDGQIRLITELVENPGRDQHTADSIRLLADKIKQKLGIVTSMNDRSFLETVVKDYNYYATLGF